MKNESSGSECLICGEKGISRTVRGLDLFVCPSCELVWLANTLLPDTYYKELRHVDKSEGRMRNARDRIRTLSRFLSLHNLLDVGTGDGMFLYVLRLEGYKNTVGIEPSAHGRAAAEAYGEKVLTGGFELVPEVVTSYHIHTITLFHVLEHIQNPREVLETIYAALPAGGSLVIETPDTHSFIFRSTNLEHELVYPEHVVLYNSKNISKLLTQIGFIIRAQGRRSFDERHASIRQSLIRLGILPYKLPTHFVHEADYETEKKEVEVHEKSSILRTSIRTVLASLVRVFGRGDHLWIIVEKPKIT